MITSRKVENGMVIAGLLVHSMIDLSLTSSTIPILIHATHLLYRHVNVLLLLREPCHHKC